MLLNAMYFRNDTVETRLGIKTAYDFFPEVADLSVYIRTELDAGNPNFDLLSSVGNDMAQFAMQGFCYNLISENCSVLELEDAPWWPDTLVKDLTVGGKVFFCTGEISASAIRNMYVLLYNARAMPEHSYKALTEKVKSGDWTYDEFMKVCADFYKDLDESNTVTADDKIAFEHNTKKPLLPWLYSTGATLVKDGELSQDFLSSDRISGIIDDLSSLLHTSNLGIVSENSMNFTKAGTRLFYLDTLEAPTMQLINEGESGFELDHGPSIGVLPLPKYDDTVEDYRTVLKDGYYLYAILNDASEDKTELATVLEVFASTSHRQITTDMLIFFSNTCRCGSEELSIFMDMFSEFFLQNISLDLGLIGSLYPVTLFDEQVLSQENKWTELMSDQYADMQKVLDNIIIKE